MEGPLGVQKYLEADIQSVSREKLLVLLYEKMVSDLLEARRALLADDKIRMADRITHSQQIITELRSALDHSVGGEISQNLKPLLTAWRQIPEGTADEEGRPRFKHSVSA